MPGSDGDRSRGLRAVTLGIVGLVAAGAMVAGLLVPWGDLFPSAPAHPVVGPGGSLSWEAEGWVKSAAPSTNSIRLASGFLGLSSVTLLVPVDALIMVGGKEGGFDDLHEGRRVRAIYDAHPSGLRAKSIEVLVDGARSEQQPAIESRARVETGNRPPAPIAPDTGGTAGAPVLPSIPGDARNVGRNSAPPAKPPEARANTRSITGPGRSVTAGAAPAPRAEASPADRRVVAPPPSRDEGPLRTAPAGPRPTQAADPGAVIDWLLKESPPSDQ